MLQRQRLPDHLPYFASFEFQKALHIIVGKPSGNE